MLTELPYPPQTSNYHYECELVVAIGKGGRDIPVERAREHIYGYAVGFDMTRRDLQGQMKDAGRPWEVGKAFDYSAPIGLIHRGHAPPCKRAIQRIAGTLAFEDRHELFSVLLETTKSGIGDFAVHLDVALSGKSVTVRLPGWSGVVKQAAKDVVEEIREQSGFLEIIFQAVTFKANWLFFGTPGIDT